MVNPMMWADVARLSLTQTGGFLARATAAAARNAALANVAAPGLNLAAAGTAHGLQATGTALGPAVMGIAGALLRTPFAPFQPYTILFALALSLFYMTQMQEEHRYENAALVVGDKWHLGARAAVGGCRQWHDYASPIIQDKWHFARAANVVESLCEWYDYTARIVQNAWHFVARRAAEIEWREWYDYAAPIVQDKSHMVARVAADFWRVVFPLAKVAIGAVCKWTAVLCCRVIVVAGRVISALVEQAATSKTVRKCTMQVWGGITDINIAPIIQCMWRLVVRATREAWGVLLPLANDAAVTIGAWTAGIWVGIKDAIVAPIIKSKWHLAERAASVVLPRAREAAGAVCEWAGIPTGINNITGHFGVDPARVLHAVTAGLSVGWEAAGAGAKAETAFQWSGIRMAMRRVVGSPEHLWGLAGAAYAGVVGAWDALLGSSRMGVEAVA